METKELFDSYLKEEMSESDKALFEKLLNENPLYKAQLESYQIEIKKKQKIKPNPGASTSDSKIKTLKTWSFSIGIAVLIVLSGYILFRTLGMPTGEKLYFNYYEPYQASTQIRQSGSPVISEGISAYEKRNYKLALAIFEQPNPEVDFNLKRFYVGLSQLGDNRPEKAIPVLKLVSPEAIFYPETNWYTAMAYLKLNKLESAKNHLEISAANPNPYTDKASELLLKMR